MAISIFGIYILQVYISGSPYRQDIIFRRRRWGAGASAADLCPKSSTFDGRRVLQRSCVSKGRGLAVYNSWCRTPITRARHVPL